MTELSFFIPGEPHGAGRPRFVRASGHAIDPPAAVSYKHSIREHIEAVMKDRTPLAGALRMAATAYWIKPASWSKAKRDAAVWHTVKPDADNVAKILCDALNGLAYRDDAAIAHLSIIKAYGPTYGVWVQLEEI
jgi:Holliday junction resolvase RusA-like endonuclease